METKVAKITGTLEMDQAIDRMVQTTNDGFSGGRVSKHGLLSWAVLYFESHCFQNCLSEIRQDYFDQVAHLESVLKQVKKARRGGAPADQIAALLAHATGASDTAAPAKRKKPSLTEGSRSS